jgi:predicted Zn-dependent peptidase
MLGMNTGLEGTRRHYDTSVYEQQLLSNGVPVWQQKEFPLKIHDAGIVMACFPNVGSIQDPPGQEGAAHFFEHIPFRGTQNFPDTLAIVDPLDEAIATWGASTSTNWTRYYVVLLRDQMEMATDIVLELATRPLIREEDVILERGPIGNEYKTELLGNGTRLSNLHIRQVLFGKHPSVHSALGYPDTIKNMTAEMLRGFQERHYHARNLQIVCAGTFAERDDALDILDKSFGRLPPSPKFPSSIPSISIPKGQLVELTDRAYGKDRIVFSWMMSPPTDNTGRHAFNLLAEVLSGRMGSPLIATLRLKLGVLYRSHLASFDDDPKLCNFEVDIPVATDHFDLAEDALFACLKNLTAEEILKGQRIFQKRRRSIQAVRDAISTCIAEIPDELVNVGRPKTYHEVEAYQDETTLEDVLACRDFLLSSNPNISKIRIR